VFENRVLEGIFRAKVKGGNKGGENCMIEELKFLHYSHLFLKYPKQGVWLGWKFRMHETDDMNS
jgi:hypothetical protein